MPGSSDLASVSDILGQSSEVEHTFLVTAVANITRRRVVIGDVDGLPLVLAVKDWFGTGIIVSAWSRYKA